MRELASSARVTSGSGNASHRSSLTSLRKLPWRDELLPRAAAAAGAVVILALAWHLAGGLSRYQVDACAQPQRMRVGVVTRPADPVVPPPVSLPPAQASVPGGRTPALPAPSDAQALPPATTAVVATPAAPGAPGLEDRIFLEAAALATKADVREELDRLTAHVASARALLQQPPAGRKLDFLMQEFMREANTLCSKSGSADLTRIGLDLKTVIDQMREQVQNVE